MGRPDDPGARNPAGVLTTGERETLRVAPEGRYLEVPGATALVGVADELGPTDLEGSQHLRRGTGDVSHVTDIRHLEEA
jgi:hypothetical protein